MDRSLNLSIMEPERLCQVAKALSSPIRIKIIDFLEKNSGNINEIAESLNIPASSAGMHVRILEEAGLVLTEQQPGEHGSSKLCSKLGDLVTIRLQNISVTASDIKSASMPIGAYSDCEIHPTCGLSGEAAPIGEDDSPNSFYLPERIHAQLLWSSAGYVEYRFPNLLPYGRKIRKLVLSMEICSEAPNYHENWKSDITVWINGADCGTWRCPGDFGARRGRLTPSHIIAGMTQYGLLTTWTISETGNRINETPVPGEPLMNMRIESAPYISVRIGNKPDAKYIGGFNLFGQKCGDFSQDIVLSFEYD